MQALLVEGGSQLLQSFIDEELWDEIYVEHAVKILGDGIKSPVVPNGYKKDFLLRDGVTVTHYER